MQNIDRFIFVRHGETDWNAMGKMQFHSDIPLNTKGEEQAKQAAVILGDQNGETFHIVHSHLTRAAYTASIIINELMQAKDTQTKIVKGILPFIGLAERYGGTLDGVFRDDFTVMANKSSLEGADIWDNIHLLCPHAESSPNLVKRLKCALTQGHKLAMQSESTLLVFGHFGAMSTLARLEIKLAFYPENATPYLFENTKNGWVIKTLS
jgi:broad specificity phosphatase PhoE